MNKSDSQRIAGFLEENNYRRTTTMEEADLIVVNMCSVRQSAVDRVFGLARKIDHCKKKNPKQQSILTGCILKQDKPKFKKMFDYLLNIKDLGSWGRYCLGKNNQRNKRDPKKDYFQLKPLSDSWPIAYVPISTGCNNFCSYCVVPYTRSEEVCRSAKDIIQEVEEAVKNNFKEIWLLGQNVNSYSASMKGDKKTKKISFPDLLKAIDKIPGDFWIRFTSSHPKNFSKELIRVMAHSKKITPYLHLAVQSGDNQILERMNRKYTIGQYKKIAREIKEEISNINLSTDIIVGFPGETKKQFENSIRLVEKTDFDMIYIARYSARPGTAAAKMDDDVPPEEKKRREKALNRVLEKRLKEKNKKYLNKIIPVLILKKDKDFLIAKSFDYKTVKVKAAAENIGNFINVKITKTDAWGLLGKIDQWKKQISHN